MAPAVLVFLTVGSEIMPSLLNLVFGLAIGLGMITLGNANRHSWQTEETTTHPLYELWSSVQEDIFRKTKVSKDLMKDSFGCFEGTS